MKKVLFVLSGGLSVAYITWFCLNVSDLVSKHMDDNIFYPLGVALCSVLLFAVMLVINKAKTIDKNCF